MANPWDVVAENPADNSAPATPGEWDVTAEHPVTTPQKTGFWRRVGENLNPMPLVRAAAHPIDAAKQLLIPGEEKAQEAATAFNKGDYGRAALSTVEDMPLVGPVISQAEQDIKNKDWGALAGTAATLALPKALKGLKARIPIASHLTPVEESAVHFGQREGVPVDLATATGNRFAKTAQETLAHQPFTAGKVTEAQQAQQRALQGVGQQVAASAGPATSRIAAGEAVASEAADRVRRWNAVADQSYQEFRNIASQPQNTQRVQTGTQASKVLGPTGQPLQVPVFEDVQLPANYGALKAQVQPVVEQLEKTLPEAQRQASPGYRALRQILDRPDQVDANTAIHDLSAIQNIARVADELPEVKGVSKGLAASAVPTLRKAIDDAAAAAGPRASQVLERGRQATRQKYAVNDVVKALPKEPAQLIDRLAANDDRTVNLLKSVSQTAPNAIPSVARAVLDPLMDDMMYQGDVRRAQSAVRAWHNMGDASKEILFPDPTIRQNITDFFNLAEMMTRRVNPSGSGVAWGSIVASFHPKILATELLMGRPVVDALWKGYGVNPSVSFSPLGKLSAPTAATVGANVEKLPGYAKGGIITQPTVAEVGEEGPEAIVPLSGKLNTVPESKDTLREQLMQLAQGDRKAVMFPHGTDLLKRPKGMQSYMDADGNTFIYNPDLTSSREIESAVAQNRLPALLGHAQEGMGAPDKTELTSAPVAVVGRTIEGTPTQDTVTDQQHLPQTVSVTQKLTPPNGTVSVEPPEKVLAERRKNSPKGKELSRGMSEIPMDEKGIQEGIKIGDHFARDGGLDKIYHGPLGRTKQMAALIANQIGKDIPTQEVRGLRTWSQGGFEGQPSEDHHALMEDLMKRRPDVAPPGKSPMSNYPGEPYAAYTKEALSSLQPIIHELDRNPGEKIGVVTHSQFIRAVRAWLAAGGNPNLQVNPDALDEDPPSPGEVERLYRDYRGNLKLETAKNLNRPGAYLIRHGETVFNAPPKQTKDLDVPDSADAMQAIPQPRTRDLAMPGALG